MLWPTSHKGNVSELGTLAGNPVVRGPPQSSSSGLLFCTRHFLLFVHASALNRAPVRKEYVTVGTGRQEAHTWRAEWWACPQVMRSVCSWWKKWKRKRPSYPFVNLMTVLKTPKLIFSAQNGHSHGFGCLRDRGQNKVKPQRKGEDVRMCFVVLQGFGMPMRC